MESARSEDRSDFFKRTVVLPLHGLHHADKHNADNCFGLSRAEDAKAVVCIVLVSMAKAITRKVSGSFEKIGSILSPVCLVRPLGLIFCVVVKC